MSTIRIYLMTTLLLFTLPAHALLTFDMLEHEAFSEIMALESTDPETFALFMEYYNRINDPIDVPNPTQPDYGEWGNTYTQMLSEPGQPPAFYLYARVRLLDTLDVMALPQEWLRVIESPDRVRSTGTVSEEDMDFLFDHQAAKYVVQGVWLFNEILTSDEVMQRVDKVIGKYGAYSMEAVGLMQQLSKHLAQKAFDNKTPRAEGVRLMEKAVEYAEKAKAIIEEVKAKPETVNADEAVGILSMSGMTYVSDAHRDLEKSKQRLANEPNEIAARTPIPAPSQNQDAPLENSVAQNKNESAPEAAPISPPTPKPAPKAESIAEVPSEQPDEQNYLVFALVGLGLALCVGFAVVRFKKS